MSKGPTRQKLILASGSPRRKELLERAGLEFVVSVPVVDETPLRGEDPKKMVARLSRQKAGASSVSTDEYAWVIAADTTVVNSRGQNLGKPRHEVEARKMLQSLQGKTHFVHTGYTVKGPQKKITRVITTRVMIRNLTRTEIDYYLSTGESMDKAGAYAAQGHGMILVQKIVGSYTNVVGLPVAEVLEDLAATGFKTR